MPARQAGYAPNLASFIQSLKEEPLESSIEYLIALLKRRQIKESRPCAIATAQLLLRVVANNKSKWTDVGKLLERIQQVGQRLMAAQPREMVVGNVVKRVLGMIRDEAKEDRNDDGSDAESNSQVGSPRKESSTQGSHRGGFSLRHDSMEVSDLIDGGSDDIFSSRPAQGSRPPLMTSHTSYAAMNGVPVQQSMFNLLSATPSPLSTPPGTASPVGKPSASVSQWSTRLAASSKDLKAEVISGIEEIIDELYQVDDQIAGYAQEHIHSDEIILTHTSSLTVQRFLLKAAAKRKFTVYHAETYPNDYEATHGTIAGSVRKESDGEEEMSTEAFQAPLTAAGITVVLISDAAVFAIMSRVNKVILATHAVIANGGLIAAAGARVIAKAARMHRTPVIVVSGIYKLTPEYPFEFNSLIEYGDASKIVDFADGDLVDKVDIDNPVFDYVEPGLVDLYITNL
jgi:translation initiation factor eIF-2B subunit beta